MMKHTLIAILALLPFAVTAQTSEFIDALQAYHNNDYYTAKELLIDELESEPYNDAAYYYLAMIEKNIDIHSEMAEVYFKKAIELDPDNFWYKYFLALHYKDVDMPDLTAMLMEELIASNPKKRDLYLELANLYLNQNEIAKALATIDKIEQNFGKNEIVTLTKVDLKIAIAGDDIKAHINAYKELEEDYQELPTPAIATEIADFYASRFDDETALSYYNQALEMDDEYIPAYYGRAHVYQVLRQYDKYFGDISKFLKDRNLSVEIKYEYLSNLMDNEQFVITFMEEIDLMINDVLEIHPDAADLCTLAGVYLYRTGRNEEASELLRKNAELYPEDESIAMMYLMILYYSEYWEKVIEVSDRILSTNPSNSDARQLKAIAYSLTDRIPEAIADYEYIKAQNPKDSTTIVFTNTALGDLYYQAGDFKKMEQCFKKVLKKDPQNIGVLNNYAYYMSLEGKNLKKAKEMSHKTILAEPDNPTYLDTYAWILHLLGQDIEAKSIFKHAMLYGGKESADILDHYAEVLFSLKEYDLAFIYWNNAKVLDDTLGIEKKIEERKAEMNK